MAFTGTVLDIDRREESFVLRVRFNDDLGREITTRQISFPHSAIRATVVAEVQRVGNILLSISSGVADVEQLRGVPITIVLAPPPIVP